jgi:lauroyl/myristoyl acyltransferase
MSKYNEYNEANIKALTQEHVNLLVEKIKEHPGHWLWFHRRFKNTGI